MKLTIFYRLIASCLVLILSANVQAITLPRIDDFQDGTDQNWIGSTTTNIADIGPAGVGDHSLQVTSFNRFVTYNHDHIQWSDNWSAAGVAQISLDVRHDNAFNLVLWLGISKGSPEPFGGGDTYVTDQSVTVPGDDSWHSIVFNVTAADFSAAPTNSMAVPNAADALTAVHQLRIIHNPTRSFLGQATNGTMLLDNIQVVPEPASFCLACLAALLSLRRRRTSVHCSMSAYTPVPF